MRCECFGKSFRTAGRRFYLCARDRTVIDTTEGNEPTVCPCCDRVMQPRFLGDIASEVFTVCKVSINGRPVEFTLSRPRRDDDFAITTEWVEFAAGKEADPDGSDGMSKAVHLPDGIMWYEYAAGEPFDPALFIRGVMTNVVKTRGQFRQLAKLLGIDNAMPQLNDRPLEEII